MSKRNAICSGLFDSIDHEFLIRVVEQHELTPWVKLYMERWLTVPWEEADGTLVPRATGIPAGSTLSPLLSNAYLHYSFDAWMQRTYPHIPWCRYGDDGLVHCTSESEARMLRAALEARFSDCGLAMHAEKTSIVYCQDDQRRQTFTTIEFDFLGYRFQQYGSMFDGRRKAAQASPLRQTKKQERECFIIDVFNTKFCTDAMKANDGYRDSERSVWSFTSGRNAANALADLYHMNRATRGQQEKLLGMMADRTALAVWEGDVGATSSKGVF